MNRMFVAAALAVLVAGTVGCSGTNCFRLPTRGAECDTCCEGSPMMYSGGGEMMISPPMNGPYMAPLPGPVTEPVPAN